MTVGGRPLLVVENQVTKHQLALREALTYLINMHLKEAQGLAQEKVRRRWLRSPPAS
jgi:hypothetical protein